MKSNFQPPVRTGLLDFFRQSPGSQFVIPVYQRNYTWTANKEVKQLMDDLSSVLSGEYANHFLGIMIYLEQTIDHSSRELSVIDGQQRLTTVFLALYAIKALFVENEMLDDVASLEGQYLTNPFSKKTKYKLKPLVADDEVYQKIVLGKFEEIKDESSNVYKNYVYILKSLKELLEEYSINDILMAFNKLYIISVPIAPEDNAQKIFESINSTGVKLTASDLIRNYLLMDMQSDKQEEYYEVYWRQLESLLSRDANKLESFFRFFLASKNKSLPNKNAVYKVFITWFTEEIDELKVDGIFIEIIKYAKYYNTIYRKDPNLLDSSFRESIEEFRKILSEMPAPFLMGVFDLYNDNLITGKQVSEIIFILNTYLIRRSLCDLDTSGITRLFPALLKDVLKDCENQYDNIVEVLKKNLINKNVGNSMYMPDDSQLELSIQNANMYNIRTTLRIFLDKLEHYNNPAPVDLSSLSVEHLMPQTPTKEWYEQLGVDEETYQRNVHRLGNLTLAAKRDNSIMQNKVWKYKNEILAGTSHLKINEELINLDKWTIKSIDDRTSKLIKDIQKLFPYITASSKMIPKESINIRQNNISASGYLNLDDGSVEINVGSQLLKQNDKSFNKDNYEVIQDLIAEEIIVESEDAYIFVKPYIFYSHFTNSTALSTSASLILNASRNGWHYWEDDFGKRLNQRADIKSEFNRKNINNNE